MATEVNPYDALYDAESSGKSNPAANPYDALYEADKQRQATVISTAAAVNPDQAAQQQALGKQFGLDAPTVEAKQPELQNLARTQQIQSLTANAPVLNQWFSNYGNASVAHDSAEGLAKLEGVYKRVSDPAAMTHGPALPSAGVSLNDAAIYSGLKGFARSLAPTGKYLALAGAALDMPIDAALGTNLHEGAFDVAQSLENFAQTPEDENNTFGKRLMNQLGGIAGVVAEAFVTRGAATQARIGAGAWEMLAPYFAHGAQSMMVPSAVAAQDTYNKVLEATDGDVAAATKAGTMAYVTNTMMGITPFATPGKLAYRMATGAIMGPLMGETTRELQNAAMPDTLQGKPDDAQDMIISSIVGAAFGGMVGPHDMASIHNQLNSDALATYSDHAKAAQGMRGFEIINEIANTLAETPLKERSPDHIKDFVTDLGNNYGMKDLYVKGEDLAESLKQSGITPEQMQESMPEVAAQLRDALTTKGDVRIPIQDWATHIVGSDLDEPLRPLLKLDDPDGHNLKEATEFYQNHVQEFEQHADKMIERTAKDKDFKDSMKRVQDTIESDLNQMGKQPADVNRVYAKVRSAIIGRVARLEDITPEQAWDKYGKVISDGAGSDALNQSAYHGSPHRFDRFDLSKIGTGEGAQAYGWGQYFADAKDVADHYRTSLGNNVYRYDGETLADGTAKRDAAELLHSWQGDKQGAIDDAEGYENSAAIKREIKKLDYSKIQRGGQLYAVDIPDEAVANMLDWDKPLSEQSEAVKAALGIGNESGRYKDIQMRMGDLMREGGMDTDEWNALKSEAQAIREKNMGMSPQNSGEDLYRELSALHRGHQAASEFLQSIGIPGLRYLDGNSRTDGKGSHNTVIWDQKLLDQISERLQTFYQSRSVATRQTYESRIDELFAGGEPSNAAGVRVLDRSDVLSLLGYGDHEVVLAEKHAVADGKFNHPNFTAEDWKKVPDWLDNPVAVFERGDGNLTVIAPETKDGKPIIIAVNPETTSGGRGAKRLHVVLTAYDKDSGKIPISRMLRDGELRYIDTKKSPAFNTGSRLQLPGSGADLRGLPNSRIYTGADLFKYRRQNGDALSQTDRGSYTPSTRLIQLLKDADLSTYLHETGHWALDTYMNIAKAEGASPEIKADVDQLLKWFGVESVDKWHSMSMEEQRPYHEQFARGFEAYLMEGKAPTIGLQQMFSRMRAWMLDIYKSIKSLGVELTPEVRGVFDRMLATDEAIKQTEAVRGMGKLFETQAESGMSDEAWREYQADQQNATEAATTELTKKSLADMKWLSNAKSRAMKALQRQANTLRKEMRERVAKEVARMPIYQAERWLKKGEMVDEDGTETKVMAGHKLNTNDLRSMYATNGLHGTLDLAALRGMTAEDGLHPDLVADMMGFTNGYQLVDALSKMEPMKQTIDRLTDQRMLESHGELTNPAELERAAEAAVHNEFRIRSLARELNALSKATGSPALLAKAAMDAASHSIAGKRIMDVRPHQYEAAEARAAKASLAALKKGDIAEAAKQKRAQILNNALAKQAAEALAEVDKAVKYFKKFETSAYVAKKVGADYMDRILEILNRFDLSNGPLKNLQPGIDLRTWVESEFQKFGIMPEIDQSILNNVLRKNYKELTLEQLRGIRDSIASLEHVGSDQQMVELNGKRMELAEKVQQVKDQLNDVPHHDPVDVQPHLLHATGLDKINAEWIAFKSRIKSMDAALLKMEQLFQWLDYGSRAGLSNTHIGAFLEAFNAAVKAEGLERAMRAEAAADLMKLKALLTDSKISLNDKLNLPLIRKGRGTSWYREEVLSAALNVGNEGNFNEQVMKVLNNTLSKAEWDFVQGVWDAIGKYGDAISDLQRRQTGRTPEMVKAVPFTTPHGEMRGGYYPVVYDAFQDHNIEQKNAKNADMLFENQWNRPTTSKGHTIARTDYTGPIHLSLSVIARHLDQVTHDLAFREPITNLNKFLMHPDVRSEVEQTMGKEYFKQFRPWLQALANDKVFNTTGDSAWEHFVRQARTNTTMVGLGFRLSTMQIHGLSALSSSIGEVGTKWMAKGLAQFAGPDRWSEARQFIYDRSPEMANRFNESDRNIHDAIDQINEHSRTLASLSIKQKIVDGAQKFAFYGVGALDMASAAPTWMGAYLKGIAKEADGGLNMSEAEAVQFADRAVRNAHGGGGTKDLAAVQRDKGVMSLATLFYSFWSHMYNRERDIAKGWANAVRAGSTRDFPALLARSWYYFVVPQLIHALLKPDTSKDNDGSLEHFLLHIAEEVGLGSVSGVPVVRDIANAVVNGRDYTITPLEQAGKSIVQAIEDSIHYVRGEPVKKNAAQNVVNAFGGYIGGLPTGQFTTSTKFLWDVADGTQDPEGLSQWWAGIQHGKY